ncbi:exosortase C-terminal domain/associated protein EpsI, partial [Arsukibacterium sp.]|uniref:exosortase C-terminal domain/associated protein EpsI n=1 Tax=Arsukibacterium sp. TaxID=1977258 RepID=UPI002FDA1525
EVSGQWTGLNVPVQFYAAFYQHIDDQKLVSWHNQPYQRQYWTPAGHRRLAIQFQHHSLKVQEVDLRANDGSKRLLWFWYGSGNYFSADPYVITAMQALGKVFHISQHGSFFAVSVHYEFETDSARDTLQQLLQQKYPLIRQANLFEQNNSALTAREPQP